MPSTFWALAIAGALQAPTAPPPQATATAWPDDRPITRLVPNLAHDIKNLPTMENAIVLGAGGVLTVVFHQYDPDVKAWADKSDSSASHIGRVLGDAWMHTALSLTAYGVGKINKDPALTHVASDLVRAQILNAVFTVPLKRIVNRERPRGGGHSFPSGHTSATFAAAAVLQEHGGWKFGVPMYSIATFVGWTRVRDKSHWLSDAAFGATLGTIAGRTVVRGHRTRQWTIVPVKTAGGAALYFVKR